VPGLSLTTEAIVLEKRPAAADGWENYRLFTADSGVVSALRRLAKKNARAAVPLDLFDEAEVVLESANQGRSWFIGEARVRVRHGEIGRSYEALLAASRLARLIARNAVGPESRPAVARLMREAFAAFGTGPRPDIILLKSLYRFARDEGYPVRQEWLASVPEAERPAVLDLLTQPSQASVSAPGDVAAWQRRLEDYLRNEADLLID
jgi:hypothetical protein